MKRLLTYMLLSAVLLLLLGTVYMKTTGLNSDEVKLQILSMVKNVKGDAVAVDKIMVDNSPMVDHKLWTTLLAVSVTPEGDVDYKSFISNKDQLQLYLDDLSNNPPGQNWPQDERLAYWINAYNAFTVKLIIDHYPVQSIKDIASGIPMIDSPWDIKFFKIGEMDMDLNTIEHQILRKKFDEYRIHFAINCASQSCPRLRDEAFVSSSLEKQLEDQEASFMLDNTKNKITVDEIALSSIFSWFESDFTKEHTIMDLIKSYHPFVDATKDIEYMEYDWSLNGI